MKNSSDTTGNRNRDLSIGRAVHQITAPLCSPRIKTDKYPCANYQTIKFIWTWSIVGHIRNLKKRTASGFMALFPVLIGREAE